MIADFVDALSAPIQFMTQAEKRAKQLQEMGIDEADLCEAGNDVCSTNKKETRRNSDSRPNYNTQISNKGIATSMSASSDKEKGGWNDSMNVWLASRRELYMNVWLASRRDVVSMNVWLDSRREVYMNVWLASRRDVIYMNVWQDSRKEVYMNVWLGSRRDIVYMNVWLASRRDIVYMNMWLASRRDVRASRLKTTVRLLPKYAKLI